MRAQAGLEYMIILGLSLVVAAILWSYSSENVENTRWDLQASYAKAALNRIGEIAEVVYIQGSPSQFYVYPNFPDNVEKTYVLNNKIILELKWKQDILRNISVDTTANLTGSLSTRPGQHSILVRALDGVVNITET